MTESVSVQSTADPAQGVPPIRATLLLFGSVALVMNLSVAVHELGHLIADRLNGLDARIVLEPFRGSFTDVLEPFPDELMGWPDAAGPIANLMVGLVLLAVIWRVRRPVLLPLLLWAPMALVQESTTAIVQLATDEPGTDWVRIVATGIPGGLVVAGGLIGLLAGLTLLVAILPVSGLSVDGTYQRKAAMLATGMGGYLLLSLVVSVVFGFADVDVARNVRLVAFVVVLALLVAVVYRRPMVTRGPSSVSNRAVAVVLTAAAAVAVAFLVW